MHPANHVLLQAWPSQFMHWTSPKSGMYQFRMLHQPFLSKLNVQCRLGAIRSQPP